MKLAALIVMASAAHADVKCLPHPVMVTVLEEGKNLRLRGDAVLDTNRHAIEFWTSRDGKFAVTLTDVNGLSCVTAEGVGLRLHNVDDGL